MDPADLIRQLGLDLDLGLLRAAAPAAPSLQVGAGRWGW
jgi:hypothetical protein